MRKIISLLMCAMLVCSLSMISVTASVSGIPFVLTPSVTTAQAGDTFTISVTTESTADVPVWGGGVVINYNPELVERYSTLDVQNKSVFDQNLFTENAGSVLCYVQDNDGSEYTDVVTLGFKVKDGVTAGTADFTFGIDGTIAYTWDFAEATDPADFDVTNCSVKIGSTTPEPPVVEKAFKVTAKEEGGKTIVTVVDSSELPEGTVGGTVYVATYTDGDVLIDCASAPLVDGDIEFALTGNVKVFVWDANNAPILNAAIEL